MAEPVSGNDLRFRPIDLVDLLYMYEGSLGTRAFSPGNAEYLELMVEAAQKLARALAEAPRSPLLPRAEVASLVAAIEGQRAENAPAVAQGVLGLLADFRNRHAAAHRAPDLYQRGPLPALAGDYARITVYFGAAMGLGDQITFFQLLKPLARHCRKARLAVHTLYPGLWPRLLPGAEEVSYRADPLQPFLDLNRPAAEPCRELVITADFEVFDLHRNVIAHRPGRDVLELSLGRMGAWLNRAASPWICTESFKLEVENNYNFLQALTRRLLPGANPPLFALLDGNGEPGAAAGAPLSRSWLAGVARRLLPRRGLRPVSSGSPKLPGAASRPPRREKTVLLNPFTSKVLPFSPAGWAEGIRQVHQRLQGKVPFEVIVFPGTDAVSHGIAAEICARLAQGDAAVPARLLAGPAGPDGPLTPLTPMTALAALGREIERCDLCVTADTFTGHLTPLFRIPTVVVAYSQFRKFWVPSRFSFNCPLEEMESRGLPLIARLLALLAGATRALPVRERAMALLAATEGVSSIAGTAAGHGAPTAAALAGIERALAEVFRHLERGFPFYEEVQRWLLLWSRLTWAHGREPASGEALRRYLERWEQSEAYKLLTLGV